MKARIGFALFIVVFLVMAIVIPLLERTFRFSMKSAQSLLLVRDQCARGVQLVTKKISAVEWKHFMQKAS